MNFQRAHRVFQQLLKHYEDVIFRKIDGGSYGQELPDFASIRIRYTELDFFTKAIGNSYATQ